MTHASVIASAASIDAIRYLFKKFYFDVFETPFIDRDDLWEYIARLDPFCLSLVLLVAFTSYVWLLSIVTNNVSQVDRMWSIIPALYSLFFTLHPFIRTFMSEGLIPLSPLEPRLVIMSVLVTCWGARLTYNFARKGGYNWGDEDYRWGPLRKYMGFFFFQLFNLGFIAIYQNILLFLISAPATYLAWTVSAHSPLNWRDAVAAGLFVLFLAGETIADQQQWEYQSKKYALQAAGKPLTGEYAVGFLRTGMFRYIRHPNYLFEILIWCAYYLFTWSASGVLFNWTLIGPGLLGLLFIGSTTYTEYLTSQKYPLYHIYQQVCPMLLPLPSNSWPEKYAIGKDIKELNQKKND